MNRNSCAAMRRLQQVSGSGIQTLSFADVYDRQKKNRTLNQRKASCFHILNGFNELFDTV